MAHPKRLVGVVALLFVPPLLLTCGAGLGAGLLYGGAYSCCALSALYLLVARSQQMGTEHRLAHRLDEVVVKLAHREEALQRQQTRIKSLEEEASELDRQLRAREHPVAKKGKRDLEEAVDPQEEHDQGWTEESPPAPRQMVGGYQLVVVLQKYLVKAQNLTGAPHLGGNFERVRDLSLEHFAIDLRRLFDVLRDETSAAIVLYSHDEKRFLFANNVVKGLFGWSPERFTRDFGKLLKGGAAQWEEVRDTLEIGTQATVRFVIKSKRGKDVLVQSAWGVIPAGVFRGMLLGVMGY